MDANEMLATTRAVRKRLDPSRDVPVELIRECVSLALQAPAGANVPLSRFVVVRDPAQRAAVADIYSDIFLNTYRTSAAYIGRVERTDEEELRTQERTTCSVDALERSLHEVGTIVIACLDGVRLDGVSAFESASMFGGVLPAMWSFMLAARARGLGTCWTTMHLARERDVADILGIPFDTVQQVCLTPLAFTKGDRFRPAARPDAEEIIHWDSWDPGKLRALHVKTDIAEQPAH
jgi:nitroreductase